MAPGLPGAPTAGPSLLPWSPPSNGGEMRASLPSRAVPASQEGSSLGQSANSTGSHGLVLLPVRSVAPKLVRTRHVLTVHKDTGQNSSNRDTRAPGSRAQTSLTAAEHKVTPVPPPVSPKPCRTGGDTEAYWTHRLSTGEDKARPDFMRSIDTSQAGSHCAPKRPSSRDGARRGQGDWRGQRVWSSPPERQAPRADAEGRSEM